MKITDIG